MSRVAGDISNLGNKYLGEPFGYIKENAVNIYVIVWGICITVLLINFFGVKFDTEEKKPVFKQVAVYEQFKTKDPCNNADKMCKKKTGKGSCTYHDCCVWAHSKNGWGCLQGDKDGPEENYDSKGSKYDEYWYLKKRYEI